MIPSCSHWKVVTFFGKEHVNWSSISGVMIGRSSTIKFGKVHYTFLIRIKIQSAKTPLLLGLRQKWVTPSCCLWNVVTFFGKEHVNWSSISGVMKGRSWTIKSIIILIRFSILIFQLLDIITPTITGPNDMFFTKKCNYFSWGKRWDHPFLSLSL